LDINIHDCVMNTLFVGLLSDLVSMSRPVVLTERL
jgi:hypothetical protein